MQWHYGKWNSTGYTSTGYHEPFNEQAWAHLYMMIEVERYGLRKKISISNKKKMNTEQSTLKKR